MANVKKPRNPHPMKGIKAMAGLSNHFGNEVDNLEFDYLPIEDIRSRVQPRKVFDQGKLEELAQSLKEIGQQQPIRVYPDSDGKYIIEQGERRFRAAKMAGLTHIYAVIGSAEDNDEAMRKVRQLSENVQRDDMKLFELAKTVHEIVASGMTVRDLARRMGKNETYISALNSVADLPELLRELCASGQIKDPVSLRRLKNIYKDFPYEVDEQIQTWRHEYEMSDEDHTMENFVITRPQVQEFALRMKHLKEATEKGAQEAQTPEVADTSVKNIPGETVAPVEVPSQKLPDEAEQPAEKPTEETAPKAESKKKKAKAVINALPDGCRQGPMQRVVVDVEGVGECYLLLNIHTANGQVCVRSIQDDSLHTVDIESMRVSRLS